MKAYPIHTSDLFSAWQGQKTSDQAELAAMVARSEDKETLRFARMLARVLWVLTQPWLAQGCRVSPTGDDWTNWRVYPAGTSEETIAEDFDLEGWGTGCSHDCSGRSFSNGAEIVCKGTRVLVKQTVMIDC